MKNDEVNIIKSRKWVSADVDWDKVTTLEDIKTLMKHLNFKISGYEDFIHPELEKYMINTEIYET
jgi:hypothetical protein